MYTGCATIGSLLHVMLDKRCICGGALAFLIDMNYRFFCTKFLPRSIILNVDVPRIEILLTMIQTTLKDMQTSLYMHMYGTFDSTKSL